MSSPTSGSTLTVRDVLDRLDQLAPFRLAEDWDNVGLLVGERTAPARRMLAALDLRDHVLDHAERTGCDVVLTHHPVIFPSVASVTDADPVGRAVLRAARAGIAVIAAHTNLDAAAGGLNDIMAALLGLTETRPLGAGEPHALVGLGRIGRAEGSLETLVGRVESAFGARSVVGVVGEPGRRIERVAICTGSGGSFIDEARDVGADVYVTGDLKYHDADRAGGMALVSAAHGAVEAECLREWVAMNAEAVGIRVTSLDETTDPWWARGDEPPR